MCTVSWFKSSTGYELFFNRDERIKRADASEPEIYIENGCHFLSPTDTEAGGSWIAVNQHGLTVCLLNLYSAKDITVRNDYISRGEIIRSIAGCSTITAAHNELKEMDLTRYRTFSALAIDDQANNLLFIWDGESYIVESNTISPKSSSSVDSDKVRASRKLIYKKLGLQHSTNRQDFLAFQRGHEPNSRYSVCMHDENRKTVSLSHIVVNDESAKFDYYPGSPCECKLPISKYISRLNIDSQIDVA